MIAAQMVLYIGLGTVVAVAAMRMTNSAWYAMDDMADQMVQKSGKPLRHARAVTKVLETESEYEEKTEKRTSARRGSKSVERPATSRSA